MSMKRGRKANTLESDGHITTYVREEQVITRSDNNEAAIRQIVAVEGWKCAHGACTYCLFFNNASLNPTKIVEHLVFNCYGIPQVCAHDPHRFSEFFAR
jgi:5-methylcytosine-specific restriction endonuclease McrA